MSFIIFSLFLIVSTFLYPSICLFLSFYPNVYLYLSIYVSISIFPSICRFLCFYLCVYFYHSIYMPYYLSFNNLDICLLSNRLENPFMISFSCCHDTIKKNHSFPILCLLLKRVLKIFAKLLWLKCVLIRVKISGQSMIVFNIFGVVPD